MRILLIFIFLLTAFQLKANVITSLLCYGKEEITFPGEETFLGDFLGTKEVTDKTLSIKGDKEGLRYLIEEIDKISFPNKQSEQIFLDKVKADEDFKKYFKTMFPEGDVENITLQEVREILKKVLPDMLKKEETLFGKPKEISIIDGGNELYFDGRTYVEENGLIGLDLRLNGVFVGKNSLEKNFILVIRPANNGIYVMQYLTNLAYMSLYNCPFKEGKNE